MDKHIIFSTREKKIIWKQFGNAFAAKKIVAGKKTQKKQHTRICSGEGYLYVNMVRNQSQEAEFLESNQNNQNTPVIKKL